ncbi:multi-copper oxidase [Mycena maculata]|uniref:Multi-copper oxidase n=1 Tax=Mycena maculata TaxID=230809 RepID=A0AAD7NUR1_9AGAR|nr:multi-copper oxidase [Mycena maculata]
MVDGWIDGDVDENTLLMETFGDAPYVAPPPQKRTSATGLLVLLLLPFAFMVWLASWPNGMPTPEHPAVMTTPEEIFVPDTFTLDPGFDVGAPPKKRVYRWTVSATCIPGAENERVVVNGQSPGPLIEANVHDRILVYVRNDLTEEGTSIHWHGLPLPHTPFYDGAPGISQCPIPPGQTLLYNFTLGGWTGTTWWHGHMGMQHSDGLFGPLIVHAPQERTSHHYDADHVLTLYDVYHTSAAVLLDDYLNSNPTETVAEPVPDRAAINGVLGQDGHYFEVQAKHGTATRLRLINAGTFAPLRVSIDAHVLTVVEADGTAIAPVQVRDLLVQPAQRYSVIIARDARGEEWSADVDSSGDAFWIWVQMEEGAFAYDKQVPPLFLSSLRPETRAILRYTASPQNTNTNTSAHRPLPTSHAGPPPGAGPAEVDAWYALLQFDEWVLRPGDVVPPPGASGDRIIKDGAAWDNTSTVLQPAVHTLPFIFSIQRTHERNWRSFINGTAWEIPPWGEAALVADTAGVAGHEINEGVHVWPGDQLIARLARGQIVDFVITNLDDGEHPFHLHGYTPWLLGKGRGRFKPAKTTLNTRNPMRRDTFTVPTRGWAVVRILADNAGYWAFHCHIAWHMAGGGLFQIAVPPALGKVMAPLPEDIVDQCAMWGVEV